MAENNSGLSYLHFWGCLASCCLGVSSSAASYLYIYIV